MWDFIPVNNYIYPILHGKIGLVNDAIDSFYDILDDNVEIMSDEEKTVRNDCIIAEVSLDSII